MSGRLKSMEEWVFVELVVSVTVLDAMSLGSWLWKMILCLSQRQAKVPHLHPLSLPWEWSKLSVRVKVGVKSCPRMILQSSSKMDAQSLMGHLTEMLSRYHTSMGLGSIVIDGHYVSVNVIPFIFVSCSQVIKVMVEGIANGASLRGMFWVIGISGWQQQCLVVLKWMQWCTFGCMPCLLSNGVDGLEVSDVVHSVL